MNQALILTPLAALALAGPALARSPHPLAPPDPVPTAITLKRDAAGRPVYCYRFTPPTKLVARAYCRTKRGWAEWGVDVARA